ncbi:hypothetical protein ID866_6010 [Astraeus odoratus]|nr:hypothetical protein ID866_6010 [Astraeus odoratus]
MVLQVDINVLWTTAILYYDYTLTIGREIDLFWKWPRPSQALPSVLFIANRYITLIGHLPVLAYSFAQLDDTWSMSSVPSPSLPSLDDGPIRPVGCQSANYWTYIEALTCSIAWSGQLTLDVVVFILTFWRSLHFRTPGFANLVDVILRDGETSS